MNKLIPFSLMLLSACPISHDADPCDPLTVETSQLTAEQETMLADVIERWESGTGMDLFARCDGAGDLLVSGESGPRGGLELLPGNVLAIGDAGDEYVYSLEHLLGTALGLPDDALPTSVMQWDAAPNAWAVLPAHAQALRAMRPVECVTTVQEGGVL